MVVQFCFKLGCELTCRNFPFNMKSINTFLLKFLLYFEFSKKTITEYGSTELLWQNDILSTFSSIQVNQTNFQYINGTNFFLITYKTFFSKIICNKIF